MIKIKKYKAQNNWLFLLVILGLICGLIPAYFASAADFNPNNLISEQDILNYRAMNQSEIQQFLERQKSTLATYTCLSSGKDPNGNQIPEVTVTAAQAFYEVAVRWGISPAFLLALVQKEQSLVTHPAPEPKRFDWATGYMVRDGSTLSDPKIQPWKGFYKQINSAAAQFQYYLGKDPVSGKANIADFNIQPGKTYNIDDTTVTPENTATAAMYVYTPHLNGNRNFVSIWSSWFGDGQYIPILPYPDGSLVQVKGQTDVWYIQYGTRRPIKSKSALATRFDEKKIIPISQSDLDLYPLGWPISLANYSLVRSPRGQIYLIVDDEKRPIMSQAVFKKIGWNPEEVEDVGEADLDNFLEGDPITENSIYPQGILAQDTTSGGIFFVKDGKKAPIWSKELMQVNYPGRKLIKLTPKELEGYETVAPVTFKDGTLIKSNEWPEVYAVSNGKLRWIPDEATFIGLGYKWANIVSTAYKVVVLHPLGETLTAL
ncbi:MAG: hypothetical protein WCT37_02070 [Patescibacteria group bacterium]|jgi:hypothetical protein